jgi:hypothetical protein
MSGAKKVEGETVRQVQKEHGASHMDRKFRRVFFVFSLFSERSPSPLPSRPPDSSTDLSQPPSSSHTPLPHLTPIPLAAADPLGTESLSMGHLDSLAHHHHNSRTCQLVLGILRTVVDNGIRIGDTRGSDTINSAASKRHTRERSRLDRGDL